MQRTITLAPGVDLVLRVPDDATLLQLVRLNFTTGPREWERSAATFAILGALLESPIETAAVQRVRDLAAPHEAADVAALSDAALWILVLVQRHGQEQMHRILYILLDIPLPQPLPKVERGKRRPPIA